MRFFFTFCFTLLLTTSFASVKISAANGDWFNPGNWIPNGVPFFEDTVIINHDIVISGNTVDFAANWLIVNSGASITSDTIFSLHGNLKSYGLIDVQLFGIGDGDSTLMYGLFLGKKIALGNPNNINFGTIQTDSLIAGDVFENYGQTDNMYFISATDLLNYAGGLIKVSGMTTISTSATNATGAIMDLGDLITSEIVTNNGFISCLNWTHGAGTASGSGKYCISDCFMNTADISGTLDVCDLSPGGFCDFNMGTIAGTVTFCTVGACNLDLDELETEILIYPKPATDMITLKVDETLQGMRYSITNIFGQQVLSGIIMNSESYLDISFLTEGLYVLGIEGTNVREKFIRE